MGQQTTKPYSQEQQKWTQLKQRQITEQEQERLSQKVNQPLETLKQAVSFLEQKKYIVENGLLGQGGSAIVLKACSEDNDYLAIKILIDPVLAEVKACQQEFEILKQFQSPHIIKVYDIIQEEYNMKNYQILIMERCKFDLKYFLKKNLRNKKVISNSQIYNICLELAKGLRDLHSINILHLDIKPANILYGLDFKWKYVDLGISKSLKNKDQTQNLVGITAQYASPEQYQIAFCNKKKSITKQSDIYSLGLVFAELTGVDTTKKWVFKEKFQEGNYQKYLDPDFEQMNQIIEQMITYEPEERLEINEIVYKIKQLIKSENQNDQMKIKLLNSKKIQSSINLLQREDPADQDSDKQKRKQSLLNINENENTQQQEDNTPKTITKKIKIIRRKRSLKQQFRNENAQQEQDQQLNDFSNSPQSVNQSSYQQQSGSNTPKLPQIRQEPSQFNIFSNQNQDITPKQIIQSKFGQRRIRYSNALFDHNNIEQNSNNSSQASNSPNNQQNIFYVQSNYRQKAPSQFSNFNQVFENYQKQEQQNLISKNTIDQNQQVYKQRNFSLPKLNLEKINLQRIFQNEDQIQFSRHITSKINPNVINTNKKYYQNSQEEIFYTPQKPASIRNSSSMINLK